MLKVGFWTCGLNLKRNVWFFIIAEYVLQYSAARYNLCFNTPLICAVVHSQVYSLLDYCRKNFPDLFFIKVFFAAFQRKIQQQKIKRKTKVIGHDGPG